MPLLGLVKEIRRTVNYAANLIGRTCFRCWNSWQSGLAIHQCHKVLPSGILEIRHKNNAGKIFVCFQPWNKNSEPRDWRWQKNPYYDPTRVEMEQSSSYSKVPIMKVIYGPGINMIKESLAATHLETVDSKTLKIDRERDMENDVLKDPQKINAKSVSSTWVELCGKQRKRNALRTGLRNTDDNLVFSAERNLVTKLGRFFNDLRKAGLAKGPPLVIKVRTASAIHDAYDIFMAPSNISLNYYRSLRVLFIDPDTYVDPSTSNFMEEDESDKLFSIFENELFSAGGEIRVFHYPSDEVQLLYLNPDYHTHPQWYAFAGAVLALAFMHQKQMKVAFAPCVYKCVLGRHINIHDLKDIDPLFYEKVMWMRENNIGNGGTKMTFVVPEKVNNENVNRELLPNGASIAVTETNKFRYIDLAVKWKLAEGCLTQLKDFRKGFDSVLNPSFFSLFSHEELESLLKNPPDKLVFSSKSNAEGKSKSTEEMARRGTW